MKLRKGNKVAETWYDSHIRRSNSDVLYSFDSPPFSVQMDSDGTTPPLGKYLASSGIPLSFISYQLLTQVYRQESPGQSD